MLTYRLAAGSTDVSVVIRIIDSADGTPETGVEHNTTGIDLEYRREGAASTDITEVALAALTTAHTDGGIEHIGNGHYRLDLPDAACASGASGVLVHGTVTGMVVIGCYIHLDPVPANVVEISDDSAAADNLESACDNYSATRGLAGTALPNVAAEAAGGLFTRGTGAGQINQANNGEIDANATRVSGTAQTAGDLMGSIGEENAAAAAGDPSATESVMQYVKQLVNILAGSAGIASFPAEAAPGNAVSLAEVIRAIHADVTGLNGDAMRGTDSAMLAANVPANFADMAITATTGKVTVGTNDDKTGYSISGTKTTLDALNDLSAAQVNAEADTALSDIGLDHLLSAAVVGTDVADNSIIARLVSASATADWDDFVNTTDSLQAIRDRGDSAWITATGFSTHSAADVWSAATRTLTAGTNIVLAKGTGITGFNDLSASAVNAEVVDVIFTDAITELSQAQPSATPTVAAALMLSYMALRNKLDTTSGLLEVHNNAGTVIAKKSLSDDGTTYSEAKMVAGP